jgi:hypothetical protein
MLLRALPLLVLFGCVSKQNPESGRGPARFELRPASGPIDILFVIDNSGSMSEEQEALARTIYNPDCPAGLRESRADAVADLSERCGFAQILAAYERDFRIGVITTDVNACDNLVPDAMGAVDWGFRPQRGCLQRVDDSGTKIISATDPRIAENFARMLSVATYGSPYERGLDAVDFFLSGETLHEDCHEDRDLMLRPNAELAIIFVTDEDDCSHADGAFGFFDETGRVCGEDPNPLIVTSPQRCYDQRDQLAPVRDYAERWRALNPDVHVAVLGGFSATGDAAGCRLDGDVIDTACFESGGISNFTGPGQSCGPDEAQARGGLPCCTADGAHRYAQLASALGGAHIASICQRTYSCAVAEAVQAVVRACNSDEACGPAQICSIDESACLPSAPCTPDDGPDCREDECWGICRRPL